VKILAACEFSGVVRDAFAAKGHDAWSCDLLPSERPGQHIQGDALEAVHSQSWDLLLFFPPCTYLCNSGVRWLYGGKGATKDEHRWNLMVDAARFFKAFLDAPVPRKAGENPILHRHAIQIMGKYYTQIIQPWQFGHGEIKATCPWLQGLPRLRPTDIVNGRTPRVHHATPHPDRWKERSRTLTGIAQAMADQWTPQDNIQPATTYVLPQSITSSWL
jgi:hypothetical protein